MEPEKNLPLTSQSETQKRSASLIKEWLFRFGVEHKEDVAPKLPLWLEAFKGIDPVILEKLFIRAFRRLKFFPKTSEILAPIYETKELVTPEEAENAWHEALKIRREHWNPDIPQHLDAALAKVPERNRRAMRAAGIFRDFEELEALHVWAKKRFIDSYLAFSELEEWQTLIPDGTFKEMFTAMAEFKMLPDKLSDRTAIEDQKAILRRKGFL